jgi:hypothetical protein
MSPNRGVVLETRPLPGRAPQLVNFLEKNNPFLLRIPKQPDGRGYGVRLEKLRFGIIHKKVGVFQILVIELILNRIGTRF